MKPMTIKSATMSTSSPFKVGDTVLLKTTSTYQDIVIKDIRDGGKVIQSEITEVWYNIGQDGSHRFIEVLNNQ